MQDDDRAAFRELQQAFVTGLAARLEQIRSADRAVRDKALHQLAGAAGAYELDALGEAARAVQAAARAGDELNARQRIEALAAMVAALQAGN